MHGVVGQSGLLFVNVLGVPHKEFGLWNTLDY